MNLKIEPGHYVVAVSGGVDSVVLLDMLANIAMGSTDETSLRLTVAHFDHGIRPESSEDRHFVRELAAKYRLPFVYGMGRLGPGASEAVARNARYDFLQKVVQGSGADAIATAHHQDDVLETAILNIRRGTGRKGLSSLQSSDSVARPLLHVSKEAIIAYAKERGLDWKDDSTNQDLKYTRNYIRHKVLPLIDDRGRQQLLEIIERARELNTMIDACIAGQLHVQPAVDQVSRHYFIMLPHIVARELVAAWLRSKCIGLDTKLIEKVVWAAKTFAPGKCIDINYKYSLIVGKDELALTARDR